MTVTTTATSTTLTCNGQTTAFNYNFYVLDATHIQVSYTDTFNQQTTLSPAQYSITGVGDPSGGVVTYPLNGGSPLPSGYTLTIARVLPLVQTTSISNQDNFYPNAIEEQLDYLTMCVQQIYAQLQQLIALQ